MKGADAAAEMKATAQISAEVEWARCECCGLTEECTPAYISKVRERHLGRWICGLCAEAVKDEIGRSGWPISTAEAIDRHASFFRAFRAVAPPDDPAEHLVAAIARVLRRSLDSPRAAAAAAAAAAASQLASPADDDGGSSAPENRRTAFTRSGSCFATLQS